MSFQANPNSQVMQPYQSSGNPFEGMWNQDPKYMGQAPNFDPMQQKQWGQFNQQKPGAYDLSQHPLFGPLIQQIKSQMNPWNSQEFNEQFKQGVSDPAMKMYNEEVLPSITSQFYSPTASYGAGLNQAINKSAQNMQQNLGQLRSQYALSQRQQGIVNALGIMGHESQVGQNYYNQIFGASPVSSMVTGPQSGWLKDLLGMLTGFASTEGGGAAIAGMLI